MSEQKARTARKAQLLSNLRKLTVTTELVSIHEYADDLEYKYAIVPLENLLELMRIVAEETIEDYDQNGFFDAVEEAVE